MINPEHFSRANDVIGAAQAKIRATVPVSFAIAEERSIVAGAEHWLSGCRAWTIRKITEAIYDPSNNRLHPPQPKPLAEMLDRVRVLIADAERAPRDIFTSDTRGMWLHGWKVARKVLIAMVYEASEPVALAEAAE